MQSGVVEVGSGVTKYYHFNDQRIAMRQGDEVYYLSGDHPSASLRTGLGSVSLTTDSAGTVVAERRYLPYGQERWQSDPPVTDFGITGQRFDSYIKLIDYGARWYDPQIGRWISPDTIIPDLANPQNFNRFACVLGNPLWIRQYYSFPTELHRFLMW